MARLGVKTARQDDLVWSDRMTARGVDFLERWIGANVRAGLSDPADADILAPKLLADAAVAGFTLADLELEDAAVEDYIREAITHLAQPGTPGD
jgi:hypothetical protein